eukprot:1159941-Pelagomonas_calceolata.AAC.5
MRRFLRLASLRTQLASRSAPPGVPRAPASELLQGGQEATQGSTGTSWLKGWGIVGATAASTVLLSTSSALAAPMPQAEVRFAGNLTVTCAAKP